MMNININITGLEPLVQALNAYLYAREGATAAVPTEQPIQAVPAAPTLPQINPPVVPVNAMPIQQPGAPVTLSSPVVPTSVPVTYAPQEYSLDQLSVAGQQLVDAGKMPEVQAIMQRFGIGALTQLPKEQYPSMAMAFREAGAQI